MSRDGSTVFITGGTWFNSLDIVTIAYAVDTGRQMWLARYDGAGRDLDAGFSLAVSPDGSTVYVTGYSSTQTGLAYVTIAYATGTGEQRWIARYESTSRQNIAYSVAVSPDGSTVYVTGASSNANSGSDYATIAYAAATGEQRWVARYDGPGHGDDFAKSIGLSADGSTVFVTGYSTGPNTGFDYATIAYTADTGEQRWVARHDGPGHSTDAAFSLAVSPDGSRVYVTGESIGSDGGTDYATIAYTCSSGTLLWIAGYNGPANSTDNALSVAVNADGSIIHVTGGSAGNNFDYATVAYAASSGAELWVARYDGPAAGLDVAYSLAESPDGSTVYVTGQSDSLGSFTDYATVAYEASSGRQLWVGRYNGSSNLSDLAYSVAVSPDSSKVFVTGISFGTTDYDYATVAYAAKTATCHSGVNEAGPVSHPVHKQVEPQVGVAAPFVHGINCDVVAAHGL